MMSMPTTVAPKLTDEETAPEKPVVKDADDEFLAKVRERFQHAQQASSDNRFNYVQDTEFSSTDDQWSSEVKRLRGNHRPALTFNRLNPIIKQIIGDYRQNKLSIKVLPASGDASDDVADILAGLIRNIEAQSNADMAYTNALECSARGGFGYFRVLTRYSGDNAFDQDIVIAPIHNPLTVYFDPAARLITREDAEWAFVTEMLPKDEFERQFPKAEPVNFEGMQDWSDKEGVRIAEYYEKERYQTRLGAFSNGIVMEIEDDEEIETLAQVGISLIREREAERIHILWKKMTGSQILEQRIIKSRYIPIVPVIGEEINIEGKVYTRSAIFYAKDAQRTYNYSKTTGIELTALAPRSPWLVTPEHIQGFQDQWDAANTTPSPYLVYNHDGSQPPPQRIAPSTQPVGDMALAMGAADDIKATTGMHDASLGAPGNETSGVAISARQNEGDNATYIFIDNLKKGIEYCGRILLDLIPIFYDAERVVRVLDLEGNPKTEVVNQQDHNPVTGITKVLNSITTGKYDVTIITGPNFASRRAEALAGMVQLAQAYPQIMGIAGDLVVKNMDWPGADQIAERIKRTLPPQITTDPDSPEGKAMANQPPPPSPEEVKLQGQMQLEQAKTQAQTQLEQTKLDNQMKLEQFKAQQAAGLSQAQQQAQAQQDAQEQQQEAQRETQKLQQEHQAEIQKMLLDHRLDMEQIQAEHAAKLGQIESGRHADIQAHGADQAQRMLDAAKIQAEIEHKERMTAAEIASNEKIAFAKMATDAYVKLSAPKGDAENPQPNDIASVTSSIGEAIGKFAEAIDKQTEAIKSPRRAIFENGRVVGSQIDG